MFTKVNVLTFAAASWVFATILLSIDATDPDNPSFFAPVYVVLWLTPAFVVLASAWAADEWRDAFWKVIGRGPLLAAVALVIVLTLLTGSFLDGFLFTLFFGVFTALIWGPLLAILILIGVLVGNAFRFMQRKLQAWRRRLQDWRRKPV